MPYVSRWTAMATSRSSTATPMWSMLPNTTASVPSAPVRLAVAANRASGSGFDPAPLLERMPGAEIFDDVEADRIVAYGPDRLVVAGGDGTIAPFAWLAGWLGVP